jgi:N-acetylglutamate synthase-like GNAT family acetyltransferase
MLYAISRPVDKRSEMIRRCTEKDFKAMFKVINDAAEAYNGVIPEDCWKDPYMLKSELRIEIDSGVIFWGYEKKGEILGVMGIQHVIDVSLIRHAYVRTAHQNQGIGRKLTKHIMNQTKRTLLVGTWAAATWAIRFYEKNGFTLVTPKEEKDRLLKRYWKISPRQIETSVVLKKGQRA